MALYFKELSPSRRPGNRAGVSDTSRFENLVKLSDGFVCLSGSDIVGMAFLFPAAMHGNFPAEWSYIRMVGVHWPGKAKELPKN